MTAYQLWDFLAGASLIFFGAMVAYASIVLRRLNEGCVNGLARFYDRFAKGSLILGQVVVVFGAGLAGNAVLGVI